MEKFFPDIEACETWFKTAFDTSVNLLIPITDGVECGLSQLKQAKHILLRNVTWKKYQTSGATVHVISTYTGEYMRLGYVDVAYIAKLIQDSKPLVPLKYFSQKIPPQTSPRTMVDKKKKQKQNTKISDEKHDKHPSIASHKMVAVPSVDKTKIPDVFRTVPTSAKKRARSPSKQADDETKAKVPSCSIHENKKDDDKQKKSKTAMVHEQQVEQIRQIKRARSVVFDVYAARQNINMQISSIILERMVRARLGMLKSMATDKSMICQLPLFEQAAIELDYKMFLATQCVLKAIDLPRVYQLWLFAETSLLKYRLASRLCHDASILWPQLMAIDHVTVPAQVREWQQELETIATLQQQHQHSNDHGWDNNWYRFTHDAVDSVKITWPSHVAYFYKDYWWTTESRVADVLAYKLTCQWSDDKNKGDDDTTNKTIRQAARRWFGKDIKSCRKQWKNACIHQSFINLRKESTINQWLVTRSYPFAYVVINTVKAKTDSMEIETIVATTSSDSIDGSTTAAATTDDAKHKESKNDTYVTGQNARNDQTNCLDNLPRLAGTITFLMNGIQRQGQIVGQVCGNGETNKKKVDQVEETKDEDEEEEMPEEEEEQVHGLSEDEEEFDIDQDRPEDRDYDVNFSIYNVPIPRHDSIRRKPIILSDTTPASRIIIRDPTIVDDSTFSSRSITRASSLGISTSDTKSKYEIVDDKTSFAVKNGVKQYNFPTQATISASIQAVTNPATNGSASLSTLLHNSRAIRRIKTVDGWIDLDQDDYLTMEEYDADEHRRNLATLSASSVLNRRGENETNVIKRRHANLVDFLAEMCRRYPLTQYKANYSAFAGQPFPGEWHIPESEFVYLLYLCKYQSNGQAFLQQMRTETTPVVIDFDVELTKGYIDILKPMENGRSIISVMNAVMMDFFHGSKNETIIGSACGLKDGKCKSSYRCIWPDSASLAEDQTSLIVPAMCQALDQAFGPPPRSCDEDEEYQWSDVLDLQPMHNGGGSRCFWNDKATKERCGTCPKNRTAPCPSGICGRIKVAKRFIVPHAWIRARPFQHKDLLQYDDHSGQIVLDACQSEADFTEFAQLTSIRRGDDCGAKDFTYKRDHTFVNAHGQTFGGNGGETKQKQQHGPKVDARGEVWDPLVAQDEFDPRFLALTRLLKPRLGPNLKLAQVWECTSTEMPKIKGYLVSKSAWCVHQSTKTRPYVHKNNRSTFFVRPELMYLGDMKCFKLLGRSSVCEPVPPELVTTLFPSLTIQQMESLAQMSAGTGDSGSGITSSKHFDQAKTWTNLPVSIKAMITHSSTNKDQRHFNAPRSEISELLALTCAR